MANNNLDKLPKSKLLQIINKQNEEIKDLKKQVDELNKKLGNEEKKEDSQKENLALIPLNSGLPYYEKPFSLKTKKLFLKILKVLNPKRYIKFLKKAFTSAKTYIYLSIVVIAVAVILSTRFFNVLQVSGDSMEPGLKSGSILLSYRFSEPKKGDIIAFYYDNKILIKRIVAVSGDEVEIDEQGNLYVNSKKQSESYVKNKSYGKNDIAYPFKVPENEYFVLGDNRQTSIDSRTKTIGTISKDRILGKIILAIKK